MLFQNVGFFKFCESVIREASICVYVRSDPGVEHTDNGNDWAVDNVYLFLVYYLHWDMIIHSSYGERATEQGNGGVNSVPLPVWADLCNYILRKNINTTCKVLVPCFLI
jgi:hypothetical protein